MNKLKKPLSNKQGENRLNKYCDELGYTDTCGFGCNIYEEDKVIYVMERDGKRMHLVIRLSTGDIWIER